MHKGVPRIVGWRMRHFYRPWNAQSQQLDHSGRERIRNLRKGTHIRVSSGSCWSVLVESLGSICWSWLAAVNGALCSRRRKFDGLQALARLKGSHVLHHEAYKISLRIAAL